MDHVAKISRISLFANIVHVWMKERNELFHSNEDFFLKCFQREREQEIYEVLPPSIEIYNVCTKIGEKPKSKNPSSKDIRRLVRKASFFY